MSVIALGSVGLIDSYDGVYNAESASTAAGVE